MGTEYRAGDYRLFAAEAQIVFSHWLQDCGQYADKMMMLLAKAERLGLGNLTESVSLKTLDGADVHFNRLVLSLHIGEREGYSLSTDGAAPPAIDDILRNRVRFENAVSAGQFVNC